QGQRCDLHALMVQGSACSPLRHRREYPRGIDSAFRAVRDTPAPRLIAGVREFGFVTRLLPCSRRAASACVSASTWSSCVSCGEFRNSESKSCTQPLPGSDGCGRYTFPDSTSGVSPERVPLSRSWG